MSSYFICENSGCYHSNEENGFHIQRGIPILVSTKSDTLCDPTNINSYVGRSGNIISKLKKIFLGESKITKKNCNAFLSETKQLNNKPKILVIGSGERGSGTNKLWEDNEIEIHGIDVYISDTVDIVCDAHYLPLESNFYDGVWIQAVLEHVVEPEKVVAEIYRVLKENGIVYAETPFMQQVHEGAYDFTRYTVLGHRYLFRQFHALSIGGNKGSPTTLSWSIKYFIWSVFRSRLLASILGFLFKLILTFSFYLIITRVYFHEIDLSISVICCKCCILNLPDNLF